PTRLVHAQRLWVHVGELGCYGDHEYAAVCGDLDTGRLGAHPGLGSNTPRRHHAPPCSRFANRLARGLPLITSDSLSTASVCSAESDAGTSITNRYRMSPRPFPLSLAGPSPRSRWTVPCLVPAGTRRRSAPWSAG